MISKDVMSYSMCVRFIWPIGLIAGACSIDTVPFVCKEESVLAMIFASSFEEFIYANSGIEMGRDAHVLHDETDIQKLTGFALPEA